MSFRLSSRGTTKDNRRTKIWHDGPRSNGEGTGVTNPKGGFTTIRAQYDLPNGVSAPQTHVYHCHIVEHVSDGSNIRIPTTNPAMENGIAGSILELVEILIPMLKAGSSSFVSKYLPRPLAPGAYVLSLEENPAEWLKPGHHT